MNQEIKRRTFVSAVIALLAAGPFAMRYFGGGKKQRVPYRFGEEYHKYHNLTDVSVRTVEGPAKFELNLTPLPESSMKYVIFLPSTIQGSLSLATAGEPDGFYVREGQLAVQHNNRNQTIIYGGDDIAKVCYPTSNTERERNAVVLLSNNGRLFRASEKGKTSAAHRDSLMSRLLTLGQVPKKELSVGTKWTSNIGRVKPFQGFKTNYEVVGFSEIDNRKTVNVKFDGAIANVANLPGVRPEQVEKNEVMKNTHSGNAWFDLETGLLVRQDTEMTTEVKGITGLSKPLSTSGRFIVQLYRV